jgi:hypothetical protein
MDLKQVSDSDMENVAMEKNRGNGAAGYLVSLFKVSLKLFGTPFFHLGTLFYIDTAGLNMEGDTGSWFKLKGYYQIYELSHSYTQGSGYVTECTGILQSNEGVAGVPSVSAPDANRLLSN